MRYLLIMFALLLTSCGNRGGSPSPAPTSGWEIGPVIDGHNYSTGAVAGNIITFGDLHYATRAATGPLLGTMRLAFHLSAPVTQTGCGSTPSMVTLYFQRRGDDWNTDGARWWATFATVGVDHAGDYVLEAPLNGPWTSVEKLSAATAPKAFAAAKADPVKVGFTFGNCTGYGHGGTGPAVLTIKSFSVG